MKTHIYFVPGLAANSKIFDYLNLPKENYELHYLEWIIPISIDETIEDYAKRMCNFIKEKDVVLVGVSFGGIIAQEMSKIIKPLKTIIISSIKNKNELPPQLKFARLTKTYKLFPINTIPSIENFIAFVFGDKTKKRINQYRMFLSVRDPLYLKWSIYNVLHWKQETTTPNVVHIHGTDDIIYPIKYISNCTVIKGGTHVMIINKAKIISEIITLILRAT